MSLDNTDTSVKVAVRIRPLSEDELFYENSYCIHTNPLESQIIAANDHVFTFDHVFGPETQQEEIYNECVVNLVNAAFDGFNATILAYGQTGSGKTWTMGSSTDFNLTMEQYGIIPRVIKYLFEEVHRREETNKNCTFRIKVQFLEIYGEDINDLLDQTRSSHVTIRETREEGVFISGAREELVSSYEQMMKALEDGTKYRTTAATKMNQTSSRSHAIFTIILEQNIYSSDINNEDLMNELDENYSTHSTKVSTVGGSSGSGTTHEVTKSKFHFVDLAGSERAKRTGAQGLQLKEGIDINKGLLALGNVISALGDDTKRGKTFVPYRDSKLTRMLQDSLGGNSKTLMICCVSPSSLNSNESVNALRYANRARNIKNKPVINRDPTLVLIDELKHLLKDVSSELLEVRKVGGSIETETSVPIEVLEKWANISLSEGPNMGMNHLLSNGIASRNTGDRGRSTLKNNFSPQPLSSPKRGGGNYSFGDTEHQNGGGGNHNSRSASPFSPRSTPLPTSASKRGVGTASASKASNEIMLLKSRLRDSDFEIERLNGKLKQSNQQISSMQDELLLVRSEMEFYRMKWADASPDEAKAMEALYDSNENVPDNTENLESSSSVNGIEPVNNKLNTEKKEVMEVVSRHLKEIDSLKRQVAELQTQNHSLSIASQNGGVGAEDLLMDQEFTSNVSSLITQTREQLRLEQERLRTVSKPSAGIESDDDATKESPRGDGLEEVMDDPDEATDAVDDELYRKRQQLLSTEVASLGQSIALKEQLMEQLSRSQEQYGAMKVYYEQKLHQLTNEVKEKEEERERLISELNEVAEEKDEVLSLKEAREKKLKEALRKKEDELKGLRKKKEDLSKMTQMQTRYTSQLNKMEQDIATMKRQRVDLTKTLAHEKKTYMATLNAKAREIEKLKRELAKSTNEVRKLGRDKNLLEIKAKDALKEGAVLRKKTQDLLKAGKSGNTAAAVRMGYNAASKISHGNRRILTEEELRMKQWIDKRVAEISARETAAESIKAHYEHQLELLHKKESLELKRNNLGKNDPSSSISSAAAGSENEKESTEKIDVLSSEEQEMLLDIEEKLKDVNGQIDSRNKEINDIAEQLAVNGEIPGPEKTMEILKRSAAGSLPAAHELIRLLFDMLLQSSRSIQARSDEVLAARSQVQKLQVKLDESTARFSVQKTQHDGELIAAASEYEQKLQQLLDQVQLLSNQQGDNSSSGPDNSEAPETTRKEQQSIANEPLRLQLAITKEEAKFLRSQLNREGIKFSQLQTRYVETEKVQQKLHREVQNLKEQITFLEADRALFKELADDLRAGLKSLGKEGKNVLNHARERSNQKSSTLPVSPTGGSVFANYTSLAYQHEDEEEYDNGIETATDMEETENILSAFENLAEEIHRTGGVGLGGSRYGYQPPTHPNTSSERRARANLHGNGTGRYEESEDDIDGLSDSSGGLGSTIQVNARQGSPIYNASGSGDPYAYVKPAPKSIYERLTNPSNYTGAMKLVFENDLEQKRRKTQKIRNQEKSNSHSLSRREKEFNSNLLSANTTPVIGGGGINSNLSTSNSRSYGDTNNLRENKAEAANVMISTGPRRNSDSDSRIGSSDCLVDMERAASVGRRGMEPTRGAIEHTRSSSSGRSRPRESSPPPVPGLRTRPTSTRNAFGRSDLGGNHLTAEDLPSPPRSQP